MTATTRDEISLSDLAAVMDAAKLLRKYGLISVEQIREVRATVHQDADTWLARAIEQAADIETLTMLDKVWKATEHNPTMMGV